MCTSTLCLIELQCGTCAALYNRLLKPIIRGEGGGEGNALATSGSKCLERFAALDYHACRLPATFLQPVTELTAEAAAPSVNVAID